MSETATDARPFEALLTDLDDIVQRLERGELSLEQALAAYEQGVGLVRGAQQKLDEMDQKLSALLPTGQLAPLERHEG